MGTYATGATAFPLALYSTRNIRYTFCFTETLGEIKTSFNANFLPQLLLKLHRQSWKLNGRVASGYCPSWVCSVLLPTPPPLPTECKCSRQCCLPKYFLPSMDVFLWIFNCIKLHRAAFWPEVISSMFPSTGKRFFLVVCMEEIISLGGAL